MWSGTPKLVFVTVLVLNCILWSQSRYAQIGTRHSILSSSHAKRSLSDVSAFGPFHALADEVRLSFAFKTARPMDGTDACDFGGVHRL